MEKIRITRIAAECKIEKLQDWAKRIEENHNVEIVRNPQKTLVLTKARDSAALQPFYLGEVLASACTVEADGSIGFGLIIGDEPERAYLIAVIDAALEGNFEEVEEILPEMFEEEKEIEKRQKRELALSQKTRVNFETMGDING